MDLLRHDPGAGFPPANTWIRSSPLKQGHPNERRVHVKDLDIPIGKDSLLLAKPGDAQGGNQSWGQGEGSIEAGVDDRFDRLKLSAWALNLDLDSRFEVRVDNAGNHAPSRRRPK